MRLRDGRLLAYSFHVAAVLASAGASAGAAAAEPCGICDDRIVTNSTLAQCFLDAYPSLAGKSGNAIVVDLSQCESERGIVPALAAPASKAAEPSVTFMVTPAQLDCLKSRLEKQDIVLDPSATIELGSCE